MRFLILLLIPVLARPAQAQEPSLRILHHDLTVTIDPVSGRFESVDRMRVRGTGQEIPSDLPEGAVIEQERTGDVWTVKISGRMVHDVKKSDDATWVAGDRTHGTIGKKGSYLSRGFYVNGEAPCPFRVTIKVPLPHRAVTVGRLVSEKDGEVTYETSYPVDGIVVVTGPWVVDERTIDGVQCRTYLYEGDRGHAKLLLDSLAQEIPRFQKLFGPVPDQRFDVVENFFATGYGFSNFALLGDTVIRYVAKRSRGVLPAGYVDHELVHCWLGNYLHVAYDRGNWCEALTTYFANYGAAEREGKDAAYRRKVSRTFSLRVTPDNDYPLRAFKDKRHDFENDIGYGKGSMVFHMLARKIGRDKLVEGVRRALREHGGKRIGWNDLANSFGPGIEEWFSPWLDRTGAPVLELGSVRVNGNRLVGIVRQRQDGPPYRLDVPVRITTNAGTEEHVIECGVAESVFAIDTKAPAERVELDPDHHIFRRVPRARVAPCMQAVLTAPKRVGFGHKGLLARLKVPEVEPSLPLDAAVLAIGLAPAVKKQILSGVPELSVAGASFSFRGKTWDQPGDAILISYARPRAPGLPVTLFHGNGEAAFARALYLPYYASHGWVVFRDGRPVERGEFIGDRATRRKPRKGEPESLLEDLLLLTDAAYKGRRSGKSYKLANQLRGRMFQTGAKVLPWPKVSVLGGSCSDERTIALLDGDKTTRLTASFSPFHESASPQRPAVFERILRHPAKEPRGALVLLAADAPFALAKEYADRGAAAVAVDAGAGKRSSQADWGAHASAHISRTLDPILSIPYLLLTQGTAEKLKEHGKNGVIRFQITRTEHSTSSIVGVLGKGRAPGILLSAHWDGVGLIDGRVAQGAADNAAGVAIVLWVAEQLKRNEDTFKRPVIVALFGAEEQGLWGSRQFVAVVKSPTSPVAKPLVAVNVDGIGSGKPGEIYLIGRSHYPVLLKSFQRALAGTKLKIGRDIDRFAFAHGSDHWPLHEWGVPAVTIYSADYRAMNTLRDRLGRVDIAGVRETARVVYRMVRELATRE